MDTTTIELLLGFTELQVTQVELQKQGILIYCRSKFEENICPTCLKKCKKVKSHTVREIRDMSLLGKEVYLYVESRQFSVKIVLVIFRNSLALWSPIKVKRFV